MKQPIKSICACIMLRRAASAVTEMYDAALAEYGISLNQYSIIVNLNRIGVATTTELAEKIGLERSTLVRNLKAIVAKGYIENISDEKKRDNRLQVTEAGREVLEKAAPKWQATQDKITDCLGEDGTKQLMDILYKLQTIEK